MNKGIPILLGLIIAVSIIVSPVFAQIYPGKISFPINGEPFRFEIGVDTVRPLNSGGGPMIKYSEGPQTITWENIDFIIFGGTRDDLPLYIGFFDNGKQILIEIPHTNGNFKYNIYTGTENAPYMLIKKENINGKVRFISVLKKVTKTRHIILKPVLLFFNGPRTNEWKLLFNKL
ncbi:MAG: hypothetical protein J7K26_01830 [Candidatus Aenigmarchaeota archaeon]|nr:hypothetical protein [Candidatus Aenigmarchaeota archaeon]